MISSLRNQGIIKLPKDWNNEIFCRNKKMEELKMWPKCHQQRHIKNFNDQQYKTNKSV